MAYVEMYYGPYLENGSIKHRVNRLSNLKLYLQSKGNSVELIPSIYYNTLEVVVALRVAFRCKITYLSQLNYEVFGRQHDPTLLRAIYAVDETINRIGHAGPNIRVPGMYKEMFNIAQDFGSGILHNNDPQMVSELQVEEDEDVSLRSNESKLLKKKESQKGIKFINF